MSALHRLHREYKTFSSSAHPPQGIKVAQDPKHPLRWHFLLYDFPSDSPYHNGFYHGCLEYPSTYPFAPPAIKLFTPSGRFTPNKELCFSMSNYHPETWNPTWNMETILVGFYSFMCDAADPATTGSIKTDVETRRTFASRSVEFNAGNDLFEQLFGSTMQQLRRR